MLKFLPARGEADVRSRWALAEAIADATPDREEQSVLVAVALRESNFAPGARGDFHGGKPTSFCAFQLHLPNGTRTAEGWSGEDVAADVTKCTRAALRQVRSSVKACSGYPKDERLAVYAAGRCSSEAGKRLSRDRMRLAARVTAESESLRVSAAVAPKK